MTNFVHAQNVSIAHLDFEARLLSDSADKVAGKAYAITDPSLPITFGDIYQCLTTLAHPSTPIAFPRVPPAMILVVAHMVEWYVLLRHRYLNFLPAVTGDLSLVQPAMFQMCVYSIIYDISKAKTELGYTGAISTLEGMCSAVRDWNEKAEEKVRQTGEKSESLKEGVVPVIPVGVGR